MSIDSRHKTPILLACAMLSLTCLPAFSESTGAYTMQQIQAALPHPKDEPMPEIKYELEKQPLTTYPGGFSHEVTASNFPISKGIAGVSMTLNPGGLRELHWHANAAEWAYVISGHVRITVIDPEGRHEIKDFGPGDVWYFPRGHGHSLQGIGPEPAHFILAFDSGYFSEFATFSVSDWLAQTPPETLGKNFNLPASMFDTFPKKEVYISQGPVPPATIPASSNPPPLTHKFSLGAKAPQVTSGGTFNVVDQRQFPISSTMAGAILVMKQGAMRQLHWHPTSDEWQYYIKGRARMTVFGAKGRKITREYGPGDVGYVPMGYGHYLETVGDEPCEMLAVFNSGTYQEISLSEWLAQTPTRLLETNFSSVNPSIIESLKKASGLFSDPDKAAKPEVLKP
jgi:oxalate decarboxylase